jgi:ribose transport system permease protein
MSETFSGLVKIIGITLLLLGLWIFLALYVPENFLTSGNIENLMRRTALYGILSVGVAFVIIASGIDLSIGSLVCLTACLLGLFLKVDYRQIGTSAVWEVNSEQRFLLIDANHDLGAGDTIWYEKDRRNYALLKIASVQSDSSGRSRVMVTGDLARSFSSTDGSPLATVCRAYPIVSFNDQEMQFGAGFPSLRARDKLIFVSAQSANRDRVVESVGNESTVRFTESISNIAVNSYAIPVLRRPLMSIPIAIASVVGIAVLLGLVHGLLVTRLNLPPFIVTLCGLLIYRGIARELAGDQVVGFSEHAESIGKIATGRFVIWTSGEGSGSFAIPYVFLVFAVFVIAAMILLNLTVWGRHLVAVGRNQEAARYSGINTKRISVTTYVICAALAGIGGVMHAMDASSITPSAFGNFFELYAITAAVLGGCSLRGGEGSILGVVVGTALMQTLYNAIILLKITDRLEYTIIGTVLLIAVIGDEFIHRAAAKLKSRRLRA